MLITSDERHVLGWHLCRAENSRGWSALMQRIAAPEVVVSGFGAMAFQRARKDMAPCASPAVRLPRILPGQALHHLETPHAGGRRAAWPAKALLGITALKRRRGWVEAFFAWSERWTTSYRRGRRRRRGGASSRMNASSRRGDPLARLINAGTLFTYLDPRFRAPRSPSGHHQPHCQVAPTRSSGPCSETTGAYPSSAGSRRLLRCYAQPEPLPAAEILGASCRRTALSKLYTKDSINRTSYRAPFLSGEMP